MKRFVKIIALVMVVALMVPAFWGCKKDENKLIMATNAQFPPYEYYEGDKIIGIDAEIAELIAKELGMELEITDMDFNGILGAVQNGTADIGMAGMTVTEKRKESVNFSKTYATAVQVVIVKEGSDIKTIDDLAGKKIGVQEATTGDIYATDDFGEENVLRYNNGPTAIKALQNGTIDAVIIDNEPAKAFVKENAGLVILDTAYAEEEYAIAVAKGNDDLLNKINAALDKLEESGELDKIVGKYIPSK